MRLFTILILLASTSLMSLSAEEKARPVVGAIRWDAWAGGDVTKQVERTLSPKKYQHRLPWFAEITGEHSARIDASPQSVMDREIEWAAEAGLDYWAFLVYPEDKGMSLALKQYLKSTARNQINFCLIMHGTLNAKGDAWPKERDRAIALLKEPGYQKVLNGRPLVYAFVGGDFPHERWKEFIETAKKAGLNPYAAFMGWNPSADYKKVAKHGFDAVSAYARAGHMAHFAGLVKDVEARYWKDAERSKTPYIPLVTTGWDKHPRKDHPVSWEKGSAYHKQAVFPSMAKPDEIAAHLKRALAFVEAQPKICAARAIIIYAWNEYDEGGWLAPTLGTDGKPDTSRLDALRDVLKNDDE